MDIQGDSNDIRLLTSSEPVVSRAHLRRLGMSDYDIGVAARGCCLMSLRSGWFLAFARCSQAAHAPVRAMILGVSLAERGPALAPWERHQIVLRARIASRVRDRHPEAAFSHLSAAVLYGLPLVHAPHGRVEISRPRRNRVHRTLTIWPRSVPPEDLVEDDGMVLTSVPRTIVDVARDYGAEFGLAMIDHALHHGVLGLAAVEESFERAGYRRRLRDVRLMLRLADGRRESVAESRCGLRLHQIGVTRFTPQVVVRDAHGRFLARVDLGDAEAREALETDGLGKYFANGDPHQALRDEKRREIALVNEGWTVHRVLSEHLDGTEYLSRLLLGAGERPL